MYGFNYAANNLGIRSYDVQHGLQGYLHPAYFFKNVPDEGYNILPSIFWVWDNSSYKNIESWSGNSHHETLLGGNPWITYLSAKSISEFHLNDSRPVILFTLQPLEPLFALIFDRGN